MRVDYRSFLDKIWEALPAAEYVAMASDPHVLGNPLLKTQHFIGSSKWEFVSETEAIGWHQLRVPHQRYTDDSRKEVAVKGHAHGSNQHWYKKIDGVWKFAGLAPIIRWGEFDFESVFASGRETFGEKENVEEQLAVAAGVSASITEANAEGFSESISSKAPNTPVSTQPSTDASGDRMQTLETTSSVDTPPDSEDLTLSAKIAQSPQPKQNPPSSAFDHHQDSVAIDQDQVELMRMAKEDGKEFEMHVEQVPADRITVIV